MNVGDFKILFISVKEGFMFFVNIDMLIVVVFRFELVFKLVFNCLSFVVSFSVLYFFVFLLSICVVKFVSFNLLFVLVV